MRDLREAEHISPTYISRLLRLALLSPKIVEAILDGQHAGAISQDWLSQPIAEVWKSKLYPEGHRFKSCSRNQLILERAALTLALRT